MRVCDVCQEGALDETEACAQCGSELTEDHYRPGTALEGMVIGGKYVLEKYLQEGGMGWVYQARHLALGNATAVKLMKPTARADEARINRFRHEAQAASRLQHPHIISIIDFGRTRAGLLYLVSELVRGITLSEELRRHGTLPVHRVLRIYSQLLAAVEDAHSQQVIHRDLKTDNIMLTQLRSGEDFVKILDFGIAKVLEECSPRFTMAGEICGTPAYMAPEQIRSEGVTVQTDIYALGVILFELLSGTVPYKAKSVQETLSMHLYEQVPSLMAAASWSAELKLLDAVVQRALAKDPRQRFQNVAHMRREMFSVVEKSGVTDLPCSACHRPHDSPLGFCSEHCNRPYPQPGDGEEPAAPVDPRVHKRETLAPVRSSLAAPAPAEPEASIRARATLDEPELAEAAGQAIERADTLCTLDLAPSDSVAGRVPPRLIGRDRELAQIEQFLDGGEPVLEIVGPPGMGKSCLLAAARRAAVGRSLEVFLVQPDPSRTSVPWRPVFRLLRDCLGLPGERVQIDQLRRRAVARGLGAFDVKALADLAQPRRVMAQQDQTIFLREITGTALRLLLGGDHQGKVSPRVFLLDDATAFDGASSRFFRRLAEECVGTPHKVVFGGESSVLDPDGLHTSVYLGPLSDERRDELVTTFDVRLPEGRLPDAEALMQGRWQGNPLLLMQGLHALAEGALPEQWTIEEITRARLELMPGPAQRLARVLAALGTSAQLGLLRELLPDANEFSEARNFLVARRFCAATADGALSFLHPTVGQCIHALVPAAERCDLHDAIFRLLEPRPGTPPAVLARHAFEARKGERALELLEQAADHALHLHDHEGAGLLHLRRALHLLRWELLVPEDDPRYLTLSYRLARSLRLSGHLLSAEVVLKEATAEPAGKKNQEVRFWLELEHSRLHRTRKRPDQALQTLKRAISAAILAGKTEPMVESYIELGELLQDRGKTEAALAELEEGLLMSTAGEGTAVERPPIGFWRLLLALGRLQQQRTSLASATATVKQALTFARREGSTVGLARCRLRLARLLAEQKEPDEALKALDAALTTFRKLGDRMSIVRCLVLQAELSPSRARLLLKEAFDLARDLRWHEAEAELERTITDGDKPHYDNFVTYTGTI